MQVRSGRLWVCSSMDTGVPQRRTVPYSDLVSTNMFLLRTGHGGMKINKDCPVCVQSLLKLPVPVLWDYSKPTICQNVASLGLDRIRRD